MASNAKPLAIAGTAVAGVGVLLLAFTVVRLTAIHAPGTGADIGAGLAGMLGVLLLLMGAGLGLGAYLTHRRAQNQAR